MIGRRQVAAVAAVTFFLALIALADKLKASPTYFDGTLEQNHQRLPAFQFTNNEQSRLLQFAVPELFVRLFGLTVPHAYMLQTAGCSSGLPCCFFTSTYGTGSGPAPRWPASASWRRCCR